VDRWLKMESPRRLGPPRAFGLQKRELSAIARERVVLELGPEEEAVGEAGQHQGGALGGSRRQRGDVAEGFHQEEGRAPDGEAAAQGEFTDGVDAEQAIGGDEDAVRAVVRRQMGKERVAALVGAFEAERSAAVSVVVEDDSDKEMAAEPEAAGGHQETSASAAST
jgi:hypothetical protein